MLAAIFPVLQILKGETLLKSLKLLDPRFRPVFLDFEVYYPLKMYHEIVEEKGGRICEVPDNFFPRKPRKIFNVSELEKMYNMAFPKSFSIIGDIIIINDIPEESDPEKIGDIFRENYGVRAVFLKASETTGDYRVAKWRRISGFGTTFTVHKENNFYYALDVSKVFFNPRLSGERARILRETTSGEVVIDMFMGVGPFSIPLAKKCATVYGIDINKQAVEFAKTNCLINKIKEDKMTALHGDSREIVPTLRRIADRIIMNFPERSISFLPVALEAIKNNGKIHLYVFERAEEKKKAISIATMRIKNTIKKSNVVFEIKYVSASREVAPRKYMIVVDLLVKRQ